MTTKNGRALAATEVKNRFGQVLSEVRRTGGPIVVQRGGKPVAVILSIESYERLRPKRTQANRRDAALAAFGMWAERADIDDEWLARGRARWRSEWQNE
ncbi:MAG: type II toxin-antitoxin system Phd/YefM family antitoxin [Chloroflexi bacterium]|nr:type II toxin-antitoxin system Phd/YefM family antitoxin [Chloroflexota bacterium]MBI5292419.1 type II toxin-antitoxin system Phd/YefM family antitoxin [Chloroflexota bacterium]